LGLRAEISHLLPKFSVKSSFLETNFHQANFNNSAFSKQYQEDKTKKSVFSFSLLIISDYFMACLLLLFLEEEVTINSIVKIYKNIQKLVEQGQCFACDENLSE